MIREATVIFACDRPNKNLQAFSQGAATIDAKPCIGNEFISRAASVKITVRYASPVQGRVVEASLVLDRDSAIGLADDLTAIVMGGPDEFLGPT